MENKGDDEDNRRDVGESGPIADEKVKEYHRNPFGENWKYEERGYCWR